jgi:putative FmdB family regulatory protein
MPLYEFFCEKCKKEVSLTLSISEREKGEAKCPQCGNRELRLLVGTFFSKTSRKS